MLRQFDFRVWDKINEEWWKSNFTINNRGNVQYVADGGTWDMEDPVIQQFTGLKDKKGKKIYEGDIIKIKHPNDGTWTETVIFENGMFCSKNLVPISNLIIHNEGDDSEENIAEVIGNIFENPNLHHD